MTRHRLLISAALLLSLQISGGAAYCQPLASEDEPWPRDPFRYEASSARPAVEQEAVTATPAAALQNLKLQGILLARDGRYHALINGREVKAGERVGTTRILSISRFSIAVEEGGNTREIDLFNHQIKWGKP